MGVSWIKLTTNIFDDEKIKIIDSMPDHDAVLVIWIKLLTLAGKSNCGGCLYVSEAMPYTDEMLAAVFARPLQTVKMALGIFESLGMIERHSAIYLVNWEKHQNEAALEVIRESDRERKRIQRDKNKGSNKQITDGKTDSPSDCPGNVPECPHLDTDIELDLELDKETNISCSKPKHDFDMFWALYPRKMRKQQAVKTYNNKIKEGITHDTIMKCLEVYNEQIKHNKTDYQYIRHPSTFLNSYEDYLGMLEEKKAQEEASKPKLCSVCGSRMRADDCCSNVDCPSYN